MIDDVDIPESDAWWLRRLLKAMHARPVRGPQKLTDDRRCEFTRAEWLEMLWARFTGNAPLSRLAEQYVDATRELMRLSKTMFGPLVVEALQDRTQFVGARPIQGGDSDGDDNVRQFLASNGPVMDDTLMYSYALGTGYVLVGPPDESNLAIATAEDPRQCITESDPARPHVVRAGLKLYRDDVAGEHVAALYLRGENGQPDRLATAVRPGSLWTGASFSAASWEWDEQRSHPLAVQGLGVPLVPFTNKGGLGEFEPHLDLLDRITNGIADRIWASKFQIFIQRAIQGDLPEDDEQGKKIDYNSLFSADPGALWRLPENAKIWESRQFDVNMLLAPVRDDLKELSAVTRTPLHMFTPDAMTGSAEGASLAREGVSFKAEDRIKRFSYPAVRVCKLGLAYSSLDVPDELEAMWAPVERYSLAQRGQAASQAKSSGVPDETIWSDVWQFQPTTIVRMRQERARQALYDPISGTAPVAPASAAAAPGSAVASPAVAAAQSAQAQIPAAAVSSGPAPSSGTR